jgi:uncharacterized repeat protein (TIGR03803 family)
MISMPEGDFMNLVHRLPLLPAFLATALYGQTFTTLYTFDPKDRNGADPEAALVQGTDGNFYGTTAGARPLTSHLGTVFKITPAGELTVLTTIGRDEPQGSLIQGPNGNFYGTTVVGGDHHSGTIFEMTPDGVLTTLSQSCANVPYCPRGDEPFAGLILADDGDFYGTDYYGGADGPGYGTVYKITPKGKLTTLYTFTGADDNGEDPFAGVIQASDGNFYGTTVGGGGSCPQFGPDGCGTVYRLTRDGTLTTLYRFCSQANCADGSRPYGALVQASDGNLYGTTQVGGNTSACPPDGCGTAFRITLDGVFTSLSTNVGYEPQAGMIQATDGNLYGTADYAIFQMTLDGDVTTLYLFTGHQGSLVELIQGTDGNLYGTSVGLEAPYFGSVFKISMGLGPFVKPQPAVGKVGATITILGNDLTDTSCVAFNGMTAVFTVNSTGTAITAVVPAGATTGTIQVVTPGGILDSNVPFHVLR